MALTIISINVNGLRGPSKRAGFLHWLHSLPSIPDIVCLQEPHCMSSEECSSWFSSSGLSFVVSPGSINSCGCIVLYRPVLSLVSSSSDSNGRFLLCNFSFRDVPFRVACVYAPKYVREKDIFFSDVASRVDPSVPTVIVGDFNTVFDRAIDRMGSVVGDVSRESSVALGRLFSDVCCINIWRYLHPSSSGFTWTKADGSLSSRIDLIGCPYIWVASVSACDITLCPFSDHWKLIRDFWSTWRRRKHLFPSLAKWWEVGKSRVKGLTISYCSQRSRSASQERDLLVRLAKHLKSRLDSGLVSCMGAYRSVLDRLSSLDSTAAKGAQVRSRVKWVEEGEVSSAFFFRLEKKRSADRWISALRNPNGFIVSSPSGLCASLSGFYSSLFSASSTDDTARDSLLDNISASLSPSEADCCEGLLTLGECKQALLGMAHGKAPGSDGLPMEFFVKFWDVLGLDLVDVLNSCYLSGSLSLSQRRGIISLVFKKGDRLDACNWRPISLLNVDYKLASRAIAGRLLKVIHSVVYKDQTCGVPGRFIGENVALLRDVVDFASSSNVPVAIISLDQEKAFDRMDWRFMRATLSEMGFGSSFIRWVDLFYTGVQSAVIVNGYLSGFFSLSRGVRQGCPLSPLLYVLVSEVLAVNIGGQSSHHWPFPSRGPCPVVAYNTIRR